MLHPPAAVAAGPGNNLVGPCWMLQCYAEGRNFGRWVAFLRFEPVQFQTVDLILSLQFKPLEGF